jgi:Ca2+-binding RTX toxin-like protein
LDGGGGSDTLQGGAGADQFVFSSAPTEVDTVVDFVSGSDSLKFALAAFPDFAGAGPITSDMFQAGTAVEISDSSGADENVRFKYDTEGGLLYYDANGAADGGFAQVATLTGAPTLAYTDIAVI